MLRDESSQLAQQCRAGGVCLEMGSGSGLVGLTAALAREAGFRETGILAGGR